MPGFGLTLAVHLALVYAGEVPVSEMAPAPAPEACSHAYGRTHVLALETASAKRLALVRGLPHRPSQHHYGGAVNLLGHVHPKLSPSPREAQPPHHP